MNSELKNFKALTRFGVTGLRRDPCTIEADPCRYQPINNSEWSALAIAIKTPDRGKEKYTRIWLTEGHALEIIGQLVAGTLDARQSKQLNRVRSDVNGDLSDFEALIRFGVKGRCDTCTVEAAPCRFQSINGERSAIAITITTPSRGRGDDTTIWLTEDHALEIIRQLTVAILAARNARQAERATSEDQKTCCETSTNC